MQRTRTRQRLDPVATLAFGAVLLLGSTLAAAQDTDISEETVNDFRANCSSCHTIGGGRLAGPDLKDVETRKDRAWLAKFVVDPKRVIDSGDPYAQTLLKDAKGVVMPTVPGLTPARAAALLDLIAVESAKEESRFKGQMISDRPLTEYDVDRGRRLFTGLEPVASGAPACIGCHAIDGIGGFGGGRLGPDLTDAFSRLEGRKALAAWLGAPPSPTMQPLFKDRELDGDEILGLVAYLRDRAEAGPPAASPGPLAFLLAGIGGLVAGLILFDLVWRRRFRAVRRPLVKGTAS